MAKVIDFREAKRKKIIAMYAAFYGKSVNFVNNEETPYIHKPQLKVITHKSSAR